jgi:opacity protein-like surface antigen
MRKLVIGMAMASTALTSPALARDGQWYIQGDGGVMIVEDQDFDVNGTPDSATANYDVDYDFGAAVGYDFGAFRLEAEASYRAADLESVQSGPLGLALNPVQGGGFSTFNGSREALGEVNALSFMLNGLIDLGDDDGLQAFAGGGVGVARVDLEGRVNANGPGIWNDSDTGFAWQLLAGIRAPLSDSWDVGLKYRYFNAPDVNIVDPLGRALDTGLTTHSLLGSITYNFGGEKPVAAPVVAPPPPSRPSSRRRAATAAS